MEMQEFVKYRNPIEYLKIFFRRKWLFIIPVFLGLVISIFACFLLPPKYMSATVILVEEEKVMNPLFQGLAISTSVAQRMRTIKEQVLSWNSLVGLAQRLGLDKKVSNQAGFEDLIKDLRRNIHVQLRGASIIRLAYYGYTPKETQLVAKTLTDVLIEENMRQQTKEAEVAVNFINEQLGVYKRKIKESEIAEMQERLQKLLIDSTEMHPLVKELRGKMAAAQKELSSGEYQVTASPQPIASPVQTALKKEIDKLINQDEQTTDPLSSMAYASSAGEEKYDPNASIYRMMLMERVDTALARDIRVNENIYNMLLQKLETAKMTQRLEASKEGTRYTIIDPPLLPLKPVKPNKVMVVFFGIFAGSFAGAGLVFGKEFMDHSFLDIEEAKQQLELPVLGAISRLVTQEEIDNEKFLRKRNTIIAVSSAAILLLIVMLYALLRG